MSHLAQAYYVPVRNAQLAEERLFRLCDAKFDRGYRLRYGADVHTQVIQVEHDSQEPIRVALRCLREGGFTRGKPRKVR